MLPLRARVDLGAMATKGYSAFPKAPALLEPHHQIVHCHIQDTRWGGVLPLCREAAGVFYSPSRLGKSYFLLKIAVFKDSNETLIFQFVGQFVYVRTRRYILYKRVKTSPTLKSCLEAYHIYQPLCSYRI